jgi:3-hydroxy-9,10-secoandrosta-1,3,5(10)-triene-9,17-dione monooxygenase reductase component
MSGGRNLDQRRFRDALGVFPTGVTIVTAPGPAGLTTNAFSSVSLDPPLVLVCFDRTSRTLPAVEAAGRFAVNFLRAGDEDLAALFASKRVAKEKFREITHTEAHGVPVLDDALAWLVCDLDRMIEAGDHVIALGAVLDLRLHEGEPLLFFRGEYGELSSKARSSR